MANELEDLQEAFDEAQDAQSVYWAALGQLERLLSEATGREVEIDSGLDLGDTTVEELMGEEVGKDVRECTCAERSWYGTVHDSACDFAGEPVGGGEGEDA